jgi:hypothetical protein
MNVAELWMGPKIAFGSSIDRVPFEIWGFSHYGPVHGPLVASEPGWVRVGSVFVGRVRAWLDPEVDGWLASSPRPLELERLLLALLERPGRAATLLAVEGLTADAVRAVLPASSARVPVSGLSAPDDDALALAELGIDLARVRASVERHFGPGALNVIQSPAPEVADEDDVFFTFRRLAASAALRLGSTSIEFDHALAGLLNAAVIERTVLRPLGLRRSQLVKRLEAQLAA